MLKKGKRVVKRETNQPRDDRIVTSKTVAEEGLLETNETNLNTASQGEEGVTNQQQDQQTEDNQGGAGGGTQESRQDSNSEGEAKTISELMAGGKLNFEEDTATREFDILRQFTPTVELPIDERPIVSIKSLTKSIFKPTLRRLLKRKRSELYVDILHKIDLRIFKDERIAVVGRNGSGKTTLAEIISGFKKPTTGFLEYNFNYDISPYEKISLLFQNYSYLDQFTVREIYEYMVDYAGDLIDREGARRLSEILQIDNFKEKVFKELSGGQKQRVSLFLTLIYRPKLLILDEFTTNLDIWSKKEVLDYIKLYLRENKVSLLLICHEPREIYKLCKKLIVIDKGRISETVEDIRQSFKSERELERFIFSILAPTKED